METNKFVEIVDNVLRSKNKVKLKYNSFTKAVIEKLKENGHRIAMIDCNTGKEWTADEVVNAIIKMGTAFIEMGISKGELVFFYCPIDDLHTIAMLAIWAIGAVYIGSVHNNPIREVQNLVTVSGAVYLVGCNDNIEICTHLMKSNQQLKRLLLMDSNDNLSLRLILNTNSDSKSTAKFYEIMSKIKSTDLLKVNFSSGTTGTPKAVTVTHGNILSTDVFPLNELIKSEDTVACLPHYCHGGRTTILAVALLQGSKIAVISEFTSETFIELIKKYSITVTMLVAAAINLMNNTSVDSLEGFTFQKVIVTGEMLCQNVAAKYIEKFNPSYFGQAYGSTEMGMTSIKPKSEGVASTETVGILTDEVQIKIIDLKSGELLGHNNVGEILVKGPQLSAGYVNNQTANAQNYDAKGFFKSGDLGYYTENGYLYVTNRIKETFKYNSQQVSPSELENILLSHESVKEVAVVGVPDEVWGDLPKAFIVLKDEFENKITEEELIKICDAQVADHKRLRGGLVFLKELKKSVFGKIDKKALKSL